MRRLARWQNAFRQAHQSPAPSSWHALRRPPLRRRPCVSFPPLPVPCCSIPSSSACAAFPPHVRPQVPGGVGRNIAQTLAQLGHPPLFLSAVGKDTGGDALVESIRAVGIPLEGVRSCGGVRTGMVSAVFARSGEASAARGQPCTHRRRAFPEMGSRVCFEACAASLMISSCGCVRHL